MLKKFLILCIFSSRGNELSSWIENVTKNKISSCKVLTNSELEIASEIVEQSPTYAFVLK